MTFNRRKIKNLVEIGEANLYQINLPKILRVITYHHNSLVSDALNIEPNIIQSQGYALYAIIRMFIEVLQELFNVDIPALEQRTVVYVHHYRIKVIIFLLL